MIGWLVWLALWVAAGLALVGWGLGSMLREQAEAFPPAEDDKRATADQARKAMGIDWMTRAELTEAIPPAYTRFLGERLLTDLKAASDA